MIKESLDPDLIVPSGLDVLNSSERNVRSVAVYLFMCCSLFAMKTCLLIALILPYSSVLPYL